jgi:hypothetical protein
MIRPLPVLLLFACAALHAQRTAPVCNTQDFSDCKNVDTSVIGGIRFEDYRVTNPIATFFTPSLRTQELSALGPSLAAQLCQANPLAADIVNAPSITFLNTQTSISEANYTNSGRAVSEELLFAVFNGFTTSDGFSLQTFGLKVARIRGQNQITIGFQPGNPGLQNIPGLDAVVTITVDPVTSSIVGQFGSFPMSANLRRAIIAVSLNISAILNGSTVTVTPPTSGQSLWTVANVQTLGAAAATALRNSAAPVVPVAPKSGCIYTNGYPTCSGESE